MVWVNKSILQVGTPTSAIRTQSGPQAALTTDAPHSDVTQNTILLVPALV